MADYLYESARVRTLESRLPTREQIEAMIAARDLAEMQKLLSNCGVRIVTDAEGRFLREETLLGMLRDAYGELSEVMARDGAIALWLYPYDCNNVKAAIKAFFRGVDPTSMMFDFGTVSTDAVVQMVQGGNFDALPARMCEIAPAAMDAYAKNRNPQTIDLMLDRACFEDMINAARESGDPFALRTVQTKIDLTNLLTVVRILRMGRREETARAFLEEALLSGGTLTHDFLGECFSGGEAYLWKRLYHTPMGKLSEMLAGKDKTLIEIERCADDFLIRGLREARFSAFGTDVLISYLLSVEYAVRNLRIAFAGKAAGLAPQTIRERMRGGDV